jgi:pSer/pThr/pTyr-binding forkhead associated (FHA) protein
MNGAFPRPSELLPVEATAIQPPTISRYTEPLPAVRPPPAPQSTPAPVQQHKPPPGPVLTPTNANGKLVIVSLGASSEYPLEQDEVNIGRMPESDICLKDDLRVSRHHAVIHRAPTAFILTDLESGNGTYVNGIKIAAPILMRSGDQIRIGQTEMTFTLEPKTALPTDNGSTI